jgi:hypothetical protein
VHRYGEIPACVNAVHFIDEENAMNGQLNRLAAAVAVTLGLALLTPATFAQTQPAAPQQQPPSQGNAAMNPSDTGPAPNDTELKHFAQAIVAVQNIKNSVQPQLASAKTPDDRMKLQQSAEKKMEAAVESHQLSPKRYVQIANLVQTDSTVRAKVQKMMPPQQPQASKS